jgi:hypothetical protein
LKPIVFCFNQKSTREDSRNSSVWDTGNLRLPCVPTEGKLA